MVAMKNALLKDTLREVRRTFSRFISIFSIVALGVGFYAGLKATCPDMKSTADRYFDDYNLMDIRLVSTIGFNGDDLSAVEKVGGVKGVMPGYTMDVLSNIDNKDLVLKVVSLRPDMVKSFNESYINRPRLIEGRYPEKPDECVAEGGKIVATGLAIGSKVKLASGTDKDICESLKIDEFTVVGIVETPYYISFDRGTSSIGSGNINSCIMIPEEDFKIPAYTDIFLTVDNAKNKLCYSKSYDDVVDTVKEPLEDVGKTRAQIRYAEILSDANKKLDDSKKEMSDAEEKQKRELADARAKLDSSAKQIADGERKLSSSQNQFNSSIKDAQLKIDAGYRRLSQGEAEYSKSLQAFNEAKNAEEAQLPAAEQAIAQSRAKIEQGENELNNLKSALAGHIYSSPEQKAQMEEAISSLEQQINGAKAQLEAAVADLEAKKEELSDGEARLLGARKALDDSKAQLDSQEKALEDSRKKALLQFASSRKKLDTSKKELQKGKEDYASAKKESDEKIAGAKKRIADGEKEIGKIEKPVWYVLDRSTNPGFADYGSSAEKIDAISKVFPLFFFLVAALVCLTTMTRMVEEQRVNIGTLKALGYGKMAIASKYLLYSAAASISGSAVGLIVGFKLFPTVIYNAYRIMYILPDMVPSFNVGYAVSSTAFAVLTTTLASWFACYGSLYESPAQLMRPKAPKPGKRIFLERIKPIWSRLNFTRKITARNIFRYKGRFFMTVIGIGGCTALLLAAFGLSDSITSIVSKQFGELYKFDMAAGIKYDAGKDAGIRDIMSKEPRVSEYMLMMEKSIDVGAGKTTREVSLRVPENTGRLKDFIVFRVRTTGKDVPMTEDGVLLTEKLARMLNVGIGNEIYINVGDNRRVSVKVTGIVENYVSNYVYMPASIYESVFGTKPEFNAALAKTTDNSQNFEDALSTDLLKNEGIRSVSFTTGILKTFKDTIRSLNYVVLVMIFSAAALAFVVLYNLTNINITERLREIATIKVLGFYDREVSSYVYRENTILTLIGAALGIVLGIFLHRFIVVTAEVDYVMFGREIAPQSFVYSALLTIVFSLLVNFVMYFRLKKISMVESMKSID